MKLLGSKLYILNTFNLWVFDVALPLCYDVGDYLVFMMTSLWHVITPSLWRWVRLEAPTLHDIGKSLTVWVWLLPIGPKVHMQKGCCVTHHSLLPMGGRGKPLSVWVRLGKAKRPHAKEVLHGVLSPTAHGGIGKSLKVWVRLSKANKPHAKRGTYHARGLWVLTCLYGNIMSLWDFHHRGGLSCSLGWLFRFLRLLILNKILTLDNPFRVL